MKIVHCVESYFPAVGGMQEVVKQLSERMAKLGHDVTVMTRFHPQRENVVINGVKIEAFKIEGNPMEISTSEEQRYVDSLLQSNAEVIVFFAAQQWATDLPLPLLKQIRAKKVSVPTGYSGLYWPEFKTYFEKMKTYIHGYDMNVYLSDDYRDINFARENGVTKVCLIPNGAAADEFLPNNGIDVRKQLNIPADHLLVLHVGSYTGWKGHRETIEIFLKAKTGKATLLMIGNNHEHFGRQYIKHPALAWLKFSRTLLGRKRVIFTYLSRPATVAAYKQANLFLFPSNIECSPIVLFECAAAKLPFLSTDVGNSLEIARWTGGGAILPTQKDANGFSHARIEESVKLLNQLIADKSKREQMAKTAFENWEKKYSWEKITDNYLDLYKALLK
jgi:glycosyltransferase involved in cell wall biosynthesis